MTPMDKIERLAEIAEFEREVNRVNIGFSRKPYWVQMQEEGDYLPEDAGMWPEENDPHKEEQ